MEYTDVPCDLDELRSHRLGRVRRALAERDLAGIVFYDQLNTPHATDATKAARLRYTRYWVSR